MGDEVPPYDTKTDILQRLSALESRTAPANKTILEKLQAYGGIVALVITIGYSWPLGVWDRFVVSAQEKEERAVDAIRETLSRAIELTAQIGEVSSSIEDIQMRDLAGNALTTKVQIIMAQNKEQFHRYRDKLFPEELLTIGDLYRFIYAFENAFEFYDYVIKADDIPLSILNQAKRRSANLRFGRTNMQDIETARTMYQEIVESMERGLQPSGVMELSIIQAEWAYGEMLEGDWKCGKMNAEEALARLKKWQSFLVDRGHTRELIQTWFVNLQRQPEQPARGCG